MKKPRKPLITFIICSTDKDKLANCLRAIKNQNYPANRMKFLIMRGYMPEGKGGGKQVGCKMAKGEFIAIVDEDNEVVGPEWLNDMLEPLLKDKTIVGSACRLLLDRKDPLINRYIALVGTDPVFAYRSLDGQLNLYAQHSETLVLKMDKDSMMVTGGNCFIYRKSALDKIGGYVQDTDNIASFVEQDICKIAVPEKAMTHHFAASSVGEFLKKKRFWSKKPTSEKFKWIPETFSGKIRLCSNIFCNLTVIGNVYKAIKHYYRDGKEPAWSLHPLLAFLTTVIYIESYLKSKIFKKE